RQHRGTAGEQGCDELRQGNQQIACNRGVDHEFGTGLRRHLSAFLLSGAPEPPDASSFDKSGKLKKLPQSANSSVQTLNAESTPGPNMWVNGTSAASRP